MSSQEAVDLVAALRPDQLDAAGPAAAAVTAGGVGLLSLFGGGGAAARRATGAEVAEPSVVEDGGAAQALLDEVSELLRAATLCPPDPAPLLAPSHVYYFFSRPLSVVFLVAPPHARPGSSPHIHGVGPQLGRAQDAAPRPRPPAAPR